MKNYFKLTLFFFLLISFAFILPQKKSINSEPPTSVKDTLSSSQLSYFARIGAGTTMNENLIKVNTAANPSRTTNNLFKGDTICIGNSATTGCTIYTVEDIGNTLYFQVNTTLPASNAFVTNYIVATRSARHIVSFTPQTNVTGGKWQFLLKATNTTGEREADGMPDQNGFDLGAVGAGSTGVGASLAVADISCPFGATASIGSTVSIIASNGSTYGYHNILCSLAAGATNPIGIAVTWPIGGASVVNSTQISNPSPNRTVDPEGTANIYNFFIRHLDSSSIVIESDTARGQIAVVESVRVTATVDPTISFIIDNVGTTNSGIANTVCPGQVSMVNAAFVTASQVPFGSLQLSAFNDLAQRISVNTNAVNGYAVTAYEDGPLTLIGGSTTIPNTNCDTTCTSGAAGQGNWTNPNLSPSKFGYSLTAVGSSAPGTMAFTTGTSAFKYKPFGVGSANAATIFSNTSTPTAPERSYVCYRISITNTQPAGYYENKIIYTATATF